MTAGQTLLWFMLLVSAGCTSGPLDSASNFQTHISSDDAQPVVQTAYQDEPDSVKLTLPPSVDASPPTAEELATPEPLPQDKELSLQALEQMALAYNPSIAQTSARVRALQGKWMQAGLPPNPTAGYTASEVGNDGRGGQQGAFVGQTFITASKLKRDQEIVSAEIMRAEQQLTAIQRRVLTDVRNSYYQALLAQRRVELAQELLQVTSEAVDASKTLVQAEEIPLAGLLQTQIRQENAQVFLRTSRNAQDQAWRRLSAVVSGPELPQQNLVGDVTRLPEALNWQEQLLRVQGASPEIAAAMADMERARRTLNRANVQAVPNIDTQLSVQYDAASNYTIAGVQVGMPIPLWNRNQGGIRQAQAEITEAEKNIQRIERSLSQRLADAFRSYSDAQITATNYAADILPRSQRTLDLVRNGYEQGEVGYLDVLAAQQTYSQANLAYLDALGEMWRNYVLIDGLMLDGSLDTMP